MPTKELPAKQVVTDDDFFPSLEGEYNPPSRSRKKRIWVSAVVAGAALLAATILWRYASQPAPPSFQVARIARGPIDSTISATGTCNAVVDVQVGSQVSGNIKALYADFNTHVKKGQLVALIDPAPFQAAVNQAKANVNAAKAAVATAQANLAKAESDHATALANVANQNANLEKVKSAVDLAKLANSRQEALVKGGVVAQQDADTAKATYDQAVASVNAAQASLDASRASAESSQKQIQVAQTQVEQAQAVEQQDDAMLAQAQLNLEHTRILAPVDGTVIARRMDVGQTVAASFQAPTIFEIAQDLTKMQVDTNVAESDVGHLKVGQQATFTVDAYPGHVFQGTVTQIRIAPINVQNVITYDAVIAVANPDLKLFPGMTANASILVEHKDNVLKVPNAALRLKPPASLMETSIVQPATPNGALVYVPVPESKLGAVLVKTGITDGNFTEITDGGLHEGQQVVVGISVPDGQTPASESPRIPRRF